MFDWFKQWKPHKTVPNTPWTATHRWDLNINRILILIVGLFIFGIGDSFLIVSGLGNAPWSVLAQGISVSANISIGSATLLISALVLLLWIPLRERPGFGTLMNILVIAAAIDIGISLLPKTENLAFNFLYVISGVVLVGIGSAFYITCGLGPGPRDGWMTAVHKKTGLPIGRVRLFIELFVLALGVSLGGTAGLGTAIFALFIGHSIAISFGVVDRFTR